MNFLFLILISTLFLTESNASIWSGSKLAWRRTDIVTPALASTAGVHGDEGVALQARNASALKRHTDLIASGTYDELIGAGFSPMMAVLARAGFTDWTREGLDRGATKSSGKAKSRRSMSSIGESANQMRFVQMILLGYGRQSPGKEIPDHVLKHIRIFDGSCGNFCMDEAGLRYKIDSKDFASLKALARDGDVDAMMKLVADSSKTTPPSKWRFLSKSAWNHRLTAIEDFWEDVGGVAASAGVVLEMGMDAVGDAEEVIQTGNRCFAGLRKMFSCFKRSS